MAPPSEFDLRAALRDGEGDEPDLEQVISAGEVHRARRRTRILSAAVVIALAGGLGAAAAEFGGGDNGSGRSAAAADEPHGAAVAGGNAAVPMAPQAEGALARVSCPSAAPDYTALRGAGNVNAGDYGSATQLFSGRVTSVVVCAYGSTSFGADRSARQPARLELAGRQAARLTHSLETAPTAAPTATCSTTSTDQYALIPVDASGRQGRPVSAQLPSTACGALVTNGTAVRYDWQPPADVAAKLDELSPSEPAEPPVPASATATPSSGPTS